MVTFEELVKDQDIMIFVKNSCGEYRKVNFECDLCEHRAGFDEHCCKKNIPFEFYKLLMSKHYNLDRLKTQEK